jgi:hypothetical protein
VLVAVDATSVHRIDAYRAALADLAEVVEGGSPGGKAATLNAAVRAAGSADVLVFADVGQEFRSTAIPFLVAALRSPNVGAVTGRYTHGRHDGIMSAWADLEALIRAGQAAGRSVVSASGSILAMQPALWRDLPTGLICDDLFTGLSVVRQGSRVDFCPQAIAYDPRAFSRDQQFTRRVRTLTGLIQYCMLQPGALLPWSNPVWGHFFVHKVLGCDAVLFGIGLAALGVGVPRAGRDHRVAWQPWRLSGWWRPWVQAPAIRWCADDAGSRRGHLQRSARTLVCLDSHFAGASRPAPRRLTMCGFCGIALPRGSNRRLDRDLIERMNRTIMHRGPDGDGIFLQDGIGLGHRRLSIVDVAHGAQPMSVRNGEVQMVYNGEVYNHPTLMPELQAAGVRYRTHCDTETILHLYERDGRDMPRRLRGMFAFAIWDARSREHFLRPRPVRRQTAVPCTPTMARSTSRPEIRRPRPAPYAPRSTSAPSPTTSPTTARAATRRSSRG